MSSYRIQSNLPKVMGMFEANKRKAMDAVGLEISGRAKEITPVQFGRLRASLTWAADGQSRTHSETTQPREGPPTTVSYVASAPPNQILIGTNVEYAVYVHENLSARHEVGEAKFLQKAVERNKNRIQQLLNAGMEGKL